MRNHPRQIPQLYRHRGWAGPDRYSYRLPVRCSVTFLGERLVGTGNLLNLSIPGGGVESTTIVRRGQYLAIQVKLGEGVKPMVIHLAAVRWASPGKFGIEFIRMSQGDQQQLRRIVLNGRTARSRHDFTP